MNPEIKKRWVEALRSGKYKQGKHSLARGENFCCLGVLCELATKEGVVKRERLGNGFIYYNSCHSHLPWPVCTWGELQEVNPSIPASSQTTKTTLSELNDTGSTFSEIADLIEKYL
jgi:hypothetical protein